MKPRERLLKVGPEALSDEELVAILLRTGGDGKDVFELSKRIFELYPSLTALADASLNELMKIKGVGLAKAASIISALELGKRLHREMVKERKKLKTVKDVATLCEDMRYMTREVFRIIAVDNSLSYITHKDYTSSAKTFVEISVKDIFSFLIRTMADGFFIVHNHKSNLKPSKEDVELTLKIKKAGVILGIPCIDHVIISPKGYISLKSEGLI